jgi:hypothetical protein
MSPLIHPAQRYNSKKGIDDEQGLVDREQGGILVGAALTENPEPKICEREGTTDRSQ